MEVKVTQADCNKRREILKHIIDAIERPCSDGDMIDERQDALDEMLARHRIASQAELIEALEPFAKLADGRRDKGIGGAVCFQQAYLLRAREAITKAKGEA